MSSCHLIFRIAIAPSSLVTLILGTKRLASWGFRSSAASFVTALLLRRRWVSDGQLKVVWVAST